MCGQNRFSSKIYLFLWGMLMQERAFSRLFRLFHDNTCIHLPMKVIEYKFYRRGHRRLEGCSTLTHPTSYAPGQNMQLLTRFHTKMT